MYLNFNVLNNEVFETGCDDKMERGNGWEFKDSDVTTDMAN